MVYFIIVIIVIAIIVCACLVITWFDVKCDRKEEIWSILQKVDKTNPKKRQRNEYDAWFAAHVEDFAKSKKLIGYIGVYGYLEDAFWENIKEPDKNRELQMNIIRARSKEYSNLLYHFTEKYQLLPEVKAWLKLNRLKYWEAYDYCKKVYSDF